MKKVLLLVLVIILAAIGSLFIPFKMEVNETIMINKSKKRVFNYMKDWKYFTSWSPWTELDPEMEITITGEPGAINHKYAWKSDNNEVGTGEQWFTAVSEDRLDVQLKFTSPMETESDAYYLIDETNEGTQVTWGFKTTGNWLVKYGLGIEKAVGESYQKGLKILKTQIESRNIIDEILSSK